MRLLAAVAALAAGVAAAASTPAVQVQLQTPWHAPPLLYEILEAVHTEDHDAFFPMLERLLEQLVPKGDPGAVISDRDAYDAAVNTMDEHGFLTEAGSRSNWDIALALHAASTKVSAFWQMYETAGLEERRSSAAQKDGNCVGSWVDVAGTIACSAADVEQAASISSAHFRPSPDLTALGHVFGGQSIVYSSKPIAILYADPYAANTLELHKALSRAGSDTLLYALRWKPSRRKGDATLSGYGAALDLKKVDYLVIDDRKLVDTAAARNTDDPSAQAIAPQDQRSRDDRAWMDKQLNVQDESDSSASSPLADEELMDISLKAAYVIAKNRNPLRAFRQLTQDFPLHANALARHASKPSEAFLEEIGLLEQKVDASSYHVALNGKLISSSDKELHPFALTDALRSERMIINALVGIDIEPQDAVRALTSKNISTTYVRSDNNPPRFDASDRIEMGEDGVGAITYWNDLEAENDPRYARWPSDLRSLLRPSYPGALPHIRLNVFNVILALDLSKLLSIRFLSETVQMASNRVGLRWGVVPIILESDDSPANMMARYFWLVMDRQGAGDTSKFLRRVAFAAQEKGSIDIGLATQELDKILDVSAEEREAILSEFEEKNGAPKRERARRWASRLRATSEGNGHVFFNGLHVPFHAGLMQSINQLVMINLQSLAEPIFYAMIDEQSTDMPNYFYDLPTTHKYRSLLLFPDEASSLKSKAIALNNVWNSAKRLVIPQLGDTDKIACSWLIGDFDTPEGSKFLDQALSAFKDQATRIGLVHTGHRDSEVASRLQAILTSADFLDPSAVMQCITQGQTCPAYDAESAEHLRAHTSAVSRALDLPSTSFGLLINGRLTYNLEPENLSSGDYSALLEEEFKKAQIVRETIGAQTAEQTLIASSVLSVAFFVPSEQEGIFHTPVTARSDAFDRIANKESTFSLGDPQIAKLHFDVLIDPLSPQAQKWSSMVQMLSQLEDAYIRVILNPNTNVTTLPLKRFYRFSAPDKLRFDADGHSAKTSLSFIDMPSEAVLTMGLDAPPTWLTMAEEAIYDLDNIRLRDAVTPTVSATYMLKSILIEGHARDAVTRTAPRGLQLVLETLDGSTQLDTIVMANLAYFQFRARPGLYRLRIREGRSADLYVMQSVGNLGWDSPPINETGDYITLGNIQGLTIYPRVIKRPERFYERLVEDQEERGKGAQENIDSHGPKSRAQKVLSSLKPSFLSSSKRPEKSKSTRHGEINVFTVASGHLYERMTYIMILSVLKHTTHSVKFWFIENFLSPSFKSFIPLLAEKYNFTYELVTYAWPHWLQHQSEKQRSIWGMKVLFLDVLFPLDLSKVIFVDADQIVRADLIELINTDLQGAPYGLPPMGNDSIDMDNFRFWESGYWANFLQGKPYPISALFVVDLNRFRLVAAGDKMRGHYQALSADPGSLSNLDQDLVASMIHTVPIFSLDKEWLWCETWCSWDWYDRAKSIDLCSNPKTHEPKLDRARRQIPEWTEYDEEVAAVARRFEEQGKLGANVVAATTEAARAQASGASDSASSASHDEL